MSIFLPADILFPKTKELEKWAVVACDQFTSQPEYWERVRAYIGETPSTIHMIFPEAELETKGKEMIGKINSAMETYVAEGMFEEYKDSYVYVERTLQNGSIRKGVVGAIDLESYDFKEGSVSSIRATEKTVVERIPPRMEIRRDAVLEMPHVLLFCNDEKKTLIESLEERKEHLSKIYDFDLMEDGGHIAGWLVQGEEAKAFSQRFLQYEDEKSQTSSLIMAVGDGNHSLATAKACYEELKEKYPNQDWSTHPARYALVELENIHDEAQEFEPIHRLVTGVDTDKLLAELKLSIGNEAGRGITCCVNGCEEKIYLNPELGELAVGILQNFLDEYLRKNDGEIDYIHGEDVLRGLAKEKDAIGFLVPTIDKAQLFSGIEHDGVLPRKTFSMGHAQEKRYYLECRKIK